MLIRGDAEEETVAARECLAAPIWSNLTISTGAHVQLFDGASIKQARKKYKAKKV